MCVIIVMKKKLISKDNLIACEKTNTHGGGVSWNENGLVQWKKGINAEEIWEIINKVRTPCVAHFRISTIGGTPKELCHPFPVDKECSTALSGSAGTVLHHNGMWRNWEDICMNMVINKNVYFPGGQWSDSRALAWIVHNCNPSFLRFTGQKIALHSSKRITMFGSFTEKDGVLYSNTHWDHTNVVVCGYDYERTWGKANFGPETPGTLFPAHECLREPKVESDEAKLERQFLEWEAIEEQKRLGNILR